MVDRQRSPQLSWISVPSSFPSINTPIVHIPTARINHRIDDYGTAIWLSRIDQILSRRLDRKGIIFTVSYRRRDLLLKSSQYSQHMVTHQARDVIEQVERFKKMSAPAFLVSPTVTTGWDFPRSELNMPNPKIYPFIIVGKLPYGDTSDAVALARHEDDKEWGSFSAMETLVQECGRMTRSSTDRCEILVCDDSIRWFVKPGGAGKFAPKWFLSRYRGTLSCVPGPLVDKI